MHWFIAAFGGLTANDVGLPTATTSLVGGITSAIKLLMTLLGGLAVIFIIAGAIQMVLSTGDPGRIKRSRDTILYAVISLIVAISAYAIVTFIATSIH